MVMENGNICYNETGKELINRTGIIVSGQMALCMHLFIEIAPDAQDNLPRLKDGPRRVPTRSCKSTSKGKRRQ